MGVGCDHIWRAGVELPLIRCARGMTSNTPLECWKGEKWEQLRQVILNRNDTQNLFSVRSFQKEMNSALTP